MKYEPKVTDTAIKRLQFIREKTSERIIFYLTENPELVTQTDLRKALGCSSSQIQRHVKGLVAYGVLSKEHGRRAYSLDTKALDQYIYYMSTLNKL